MYYEEQVVDGVLCSRSAPDGEWVQLSLEKITSRYLDARARADRYWSMIESKGRKRAESDTGKTVVIVNIGGCK